MTGAGVFPTSQMHTPIQGAQMKKRLALIPLLLLLFVGLIAPPAVAATATVTAPASAEVGETVTASVTLDDVPIIAIWSLDWGDGDSDTYFTGAGTYNNTHRYQQSGDYSISVTVDGHTETTTITIETYEGSFADDDNNTFVADIEWLAAAEITRGCNPPYNTLFCPDQTVTRGQMAAFLVRALGYADAPDAGFVDTVGHIFENDINKLAAAGVTRGCNPAEGNTRYCPNDPVTRGQMAAFLVRAFGYSDIGSISFVDIADSVFEQNILQLATAGVTRGCNPADGNTRYCPNDPVTRGQMAAFLHRAMDG